MGLLKRKGRLLLLDDDTSMQKLIATLLKREGYKVDVVSSGSHAIEKLGTYTYAALLLDVMTPTDGGITVIKHLREHNAALLRRVVLVTASPDAVLHAVADEIHAIVRKPFDAQELVATVAAVVSR
jgi:DNA-binding response OmpR family regulator